MGKCKFIPVSEKYIILDIAALKTIVLILHANLRNSMYQERKRKTNMF